MSVPIKADKRLKNSNGHSLAIYCTVIVSHLFNIKYINRLSIIISFLFPGVLKRGDDAADGAEVRRRVRFDPVCKQPLIHSRQLQDGWHGGDHRRLAALLQTDVHHECGQCGVLAAHGHCHILRSTGPRRREAGGTDPGLLHPDVAQLHRKQTQRRAQVQHPVCQAAVHPDGAAYAGQPELQHVHLAEAEEPQAAALLGGDLGRDGRGRPPGPRHGSAPLTFPCPFSQSAFNPSDTRHP